MAAEPPPGAPKPPSLEGDDWQGAVAALQLGVRAKSSQGDLENHLVGLEQGFIGDDKWVFPKIMVPQTAWFIMENPIKMDDLGVPVFLETSTNYPVSSEQMKKKGPVLVV